MYCSSLSCWNIACQTHGDTKNDVAIEEKKTEEKEEKEAEQKIQIFVAWKERGIEPRMEALSVDSTAPLSSLREHVAAVMRVQGGSISLFLGDPPKMCLDPFFEEAEEPLAIGTLLHPMSCITAQLAATSTAVVQSHPKDVKENSFDWAAMLADNAGPFEQKVLFGNALLVENLLSNDECDKMIAASETLGYEDIDYNPKYRSNTRVVIFNQLLADKLYPRIQACQTIPKCVLDPTTGFKWHMIGLNPSFRFCRYLPPQHFSAHCDGAFQASEDEVTWYTVNLYLNSGFQGGTTRFFVFPKEKKLVPKKSAQKKKAGEPEEYEEVDLLLTTAQLKERGPSHIIVPETGLALVFDHWSCSYLHDGAPLEQGVKYILRTDVLYKRQPLGTCHCP